MKRFVCVCLMLALLLLPVLPRGARATITPLEDMDTSTMVYELYVPEIDVSLFLPLTTRSELVMQNERMNAYVLMPPDFDDTHFVLFTLPAPQFKGKSFDTMGDEDFLEVIRVISDNAEIAQYNLIGNYYEDVDILRVVEPRDEALDIYYAEHLLALYDGYVLNVMVQRADGSSAISQEALAQRDTFLMQVLNQEGKPRHYTSYALPGSDMAMFTTEETEDFVYLTVQPPSDFGGNFTWIAQRSDAYVGQTVETLPEAQLIEAVEQTLLMPFIDGSGFIDTTTVPGVPILCYQSEMREGYPNRHRLALLDGYAVSVYFLGVQMTYDSVWIDRCLSAYMRMVLTGEGAFPIAEPASVHIADGKLILPVGDAYLAYAIPEDRTVDIAEETDTECVAYIVPKNGTNNKMLVIFVQYMGRSYDMLTMSEKTLASKAQTTGAAMQAKYGNAFTWELREQGVLGLPTLVVADQTGIVSQHDVIIGNYYVVIRYFSQDGTPFTKEDIEDGLSRFTLIPVADAQ